MSDALELRDEIFAAKLAEHHEKINTLFRVREHLSPLEFQSRFEQEQVAGAAVVSAFLEPLFIRENITDHAERKRLCEVGLSQSSMLRSRIYQPSRIESKAKQHASDDDTASTIDSYKYNIVQGAIARMNGRIETA